MKSVWYMYRKFLWSLFLYSPLFIEPARAEIHQVPGVIHIDALGPLPEQPSIPQVVDMVERANLGVAIITPHDNAIIEYGLPPLRHVLKWSFEQMSIRKFGAAEYMETVQMTDDYTPGVITIAGAEVVPAYYWEGDFWQGSLIARNLHKHLLVIGLPNPEDYEYLPSIAAGFPAQWRVDHLIHLWPIGLILLGLIKLLPFSYKKSGHMFHHVKWPYVCLVVGVIFLFNNLSLFSPYDQYHNNSGEGPYQAVIDYANTRNAMTFWAHPEVTQRMTMPTPWPMSMLIDSVRFETMAYPSSLLRTSGYTGFSIFEEGMYVIGRPGGIWDQVLNEYCTGVRSRPVWAIGEADFEGRERDVLLKSSQTVFLLNERTRSGVLDALRKGRMYARRAPGHDLALGSFRVLDLNGQTSATMGDHITVSGKVSVLIDLEITGDIPHNMSVQVIRGGVLIRTLHAAKAPTILFEDTVSSPETTFYRCLVLIDGWPVIASNPIFVSFRD